jgi:hypothetical protein
MRSVKAYILGCEIELPGHCAGGRAMRRCSNTRADARTDRISWSVRARRATGRARSRRPTEGSCRAASECPSSGYGLCAHSCARPSASKKAAVVGRPARLGVVDPRGHVAKAFQAGQDVARVNRIGPAQGRPRHTAMSLGTLGGQPALDGAGHPTAVSSSSPCTTSTSHAPKRFALWRLIGRPGLVAKYPSGSTHRSSGTHRAASAARARRSSRDLE